ncbi:MAG: hypothetical protein HWD61_01075 [Parachlamydiaceae bacterium]|nr:MAG: hypothetical protein HWD61_01075 [Parachlamydiaceae bacterium]
MFLEVSNEFLEKQEFDRAFDSINHKEVFALDDHYNELAQVLTDNGELEKAITVASKLSNYKLKESLFQQIFNLYIERGLIDEAKIN